MAVAPLGVVVVLLAQWLDGSAISGLLQGSSALVVGGGTLAAILLTYTPTEIFRAMRAAVHAFKAEEDDLDVLAATMVTLAIASIAKDCRRSSRSSTTIRTPSSGTVWRSSSTGSSRPTSTRC
jgi:flagellar motor component MotA